MAISELRNRFFQQGKPYNEFLSEQIAGDLLKPKSESDREENLIATGFLALGSMDLNERDTEQFQLDRIDDQIDTVGRATMGLTLACARCHDHKFDPSRKRITTHCRHFCQHRNAKWPTKSARRKQRVFSTGQACKHS